MLAGSEEIPVVLMGRLQVARGPLVLLDEDLSGRGWPWRGSLLLQPEPARVESTRLQVTSTV